MILSYTKGCQGAAQYPDRVNGLSIGVAWSFLSHCTRA